MSYANASESEANIEIQNTDPSISKLRDCEESGTLKFKSKTQTSKGVAPGSLEFAEMAFAELERYTGSVFKPKYLVRGSHLEVRRTP